MNNSNEINLNDIPVEEFSKYAEMVTLWIQDYLQNIEKYPVLSSVEPGSIVKKLPSEPPEKGEEFSEIMKDFQDIIIPGVTHWNHPGFMAYFNSTSSGPGILAEYLIAALNLNGMLWRTSPSVTELEQVTLDWLKKMTGLDSSFQGIIYDTASVSTMHAIAAARERAGFNIHLKGMSGRTDLPLLRLYCSEFTHSSIEKGAVTLGIGVNGVRKIAVDDQFRIIPSELEKAIEEDKKNGDFPFCAVATIGTTSVTSIDPVSDIADICKKHNIWLHVDAAYAGVSAMIPELKWIMNGTEKADSIVLNPHKWMFTPIDLSAFFIKDREILKEAFSLVPEYLRSYNETENLMDTGVQLGRRFRSLKLWFIIRYFGVEGIRERLKHHIALAKSFEQWIDSDSRFVKMAKVNFGTVCFRAVKENLSAEKLNELNEKLMHEVNASGKIFISHTKLRGLFVLRVVTSGLRTRERHVETAKEIISAAYNKLFA